MSSDDLDTRRFISTRDGVSVDWGALGRFIGGGFLVTIGLVWSDIVSTGYATVAALITWIGSAISGGIQALGDGVLLLVNTAFGAGLGWISFLGPLAPIAGVAFALLMVYLLMEAQ